MHCDIGYTMKRNVYWRNATERTKDEDFSVECNVVQYSQTKQFEIISGNKTSKHPCVEYKSPENQVLIVQRVDSSQWLGFT